MGGRKEREGIIKKILDLSAAQESGLKVFPKEHIYFQGIVLLQRHILNSAFIFKVKYNFVHRSKMDVKKGNLDFTL